MPDDDMTRMEPEGTRPTDKELDPDANHPKPDKETQEHIDKKMAELDKPSEHFVHIYNVRPIFCALIQAEDWRRGSQKEIDENIQWYIKLAYTMAERLDNHQP